MTRSVGRDGDDVGAVGIGRVERDGEAEVRRQPGGDVDPGLARVVGAVDAAVKLHEQALGARGRALDVVHAEVDRGRARLLGQVVGDDPLVAVAPRRAAVVGQPDRRPRRSRARGGRGRRARARSSAPTGRPSRASSAARVGCSKSARLSSHVSPPSRLSKRTPGSPPAHRRASRRRRRRSTQMRLSAASPPRGRLTPFAACQSPPRGRR